MAILAIVTVLAWRGLDQVARARDSIIDFLSEERSTTQFFDQLRYDADSVALDSEVNDPPVQISDTEMRLVRHLYQPGLAPRMQVVRYVVTGNHLVRYASIPLANLGDVHTDLGVDLQDSPNWSVYPLDTPVADASMRVWVVGVGWTGREDDLIAAMEANRATSNLATGVATPATRTVTGLLVRIQGAKMRFPLTRVVLVGG
jgi:general secretion pathway protein J